MHHILRQISAFSLVATSIVVSLSPSHAVQAAVAEDLTSYAVGSLPGQLSVDQGAANYSIPIGVPKGVAGVEPELAFGYTSMGGGGTMGLGWSLGGFSSITRCGRTLEQDGSKIGIEWKQSDRYCLDGQRLIVTSGVYGADGSEYTTEIQSFARIIAHGQAGNGPAWFSVETKAGQLLEYGNTEDSRIEAYGRSEASAWAQNKISDAVGNGLTISYFEAVDHTEFYPIEVAYSDNVIEMTYETLPDSETEPRYISGVKFQSTVQLNNLVVKTGISTGNPVDYSEYKLAYNKRDNKIDLLDSVQLCGSEDCQAPTRFTWNEPDELSSAYGERSVWLDDGYPVSNITEDASPYRPVDINNDGLDDLFIVQESYHWITGTRYSVAIFISDGNSLNHIYTSSKCENCEYSIGDVDGDGFLDLLRATGSVLDVALGKDGGFDAFSTWMGNGFPFRQYGGEKPAPFIVVDVNDDGLGDVVARKKLNRWSASLNGYEVLESTGSTFLQTYSGESGDQFGIGDVDGDGYVDLVSASSHYLNVALGSSDGFGDYRKWATDYLHSGPDYNEGPSNIAVPFVLKDHNRDGILDVVAKQKNHNFGFTTITPYISDGNSFKKNTCYECRTESTDLNGDGISDKVKTGSRGRVDVSHGLSPKPEQLVQIDDALGNIIAINYGELSDTGLHTLAEDQQYPFRIIRGPIPLVASVDKDNGQEGVITTSYTYGGAIAHAKGRGFLGYAWDQVTDESTGITTRTEYRQDFPFVGMPASVSTFKADGTVLSSNSSIFAKRTSTHKETLTDGSSYRYLSYFPYLSEKTEQSFELDGSPVSSITTLQSGYDSYGNVGTVEVITTAGSETHKKLTSNLYDNHVSRTRWHLGRLREARVIHTHNNGSTISRKSAFEYDADTGLLNKEIIEPDQPAYRQITTYEYDSFGNKVRVSVSGQDVATRTTTSAYDPSGRFATSVENALGHSETRIYDQQHGKALSLTGPNGLTTEWAYDSWGRKTAEHRADGTSSLITRSWVDENDEHAPVNAIYRVSTQSPVILNADGTLASSAAPASTQYYDRLGRVIRKLSFGFDGQATYQDTVFDSQGREEKSSLPYFQGDTAYWAVNHYDEVNRVFRKTFDTGKDTITTQVSFDGLTTTSTNTLGQIKITTKNAMGKVAEVLEEEGGRVSYEYDAIGNLLKTHQHDDANGKVITTELQYDVRGQKVGMIDPDMGQWSYSYNTFGELVSQKDAKGQVVEMQYDALGRMRLRLEADGIAIWRYDNAANGIGKLASVSHYDIEPSDFSGLENLPIEKRSYHQEPSYDSFGRVNATSTQMDEKTFITATDYDQYGRVYKTYRPNGFEIRNLYNANGYLLAKQSPESVLSVSEVQAGYDQALTDLLQTEQKKQLLQTKIDDWRKQAAKKAKLAQRFDEAVLALANVADPATHLSQVVSSTGQKIFPYSGISIPEMHTPYFVYEDPNGRIYLEIIDKDPSYEVHYAQLLGSHWYIKYSPEYWQSSILPNLTLLNKQLIFSDIDGNGTVDYLYSDQAGESFDSSILHKKYLAAIQGEIDAVLAAHVQGQDLPWLPLISIGKAYRVMEQYGQTNPVYLEAVDVDNTRPYSVAYGGGSGYGPAGKNFINVSASKWPSYTNGSAVDSDREVMVGDFNLDTRLDYIYSDQAPWLFAKGSGFTGTLGEQAAALRTQSESFTTQADDAELQIVGINTIIQQLNTQIAQSLAQKTSDASTYYSHIGTLYENALSSATAAVAAATTYAEKSAYLQQRASDYESAVGLVNPETDSGLITEIISLSSEIRAVALQLNDWADDGLSVAEQIITMMSHIQDHHRQAQYWADSSQPEDIDAMMSDDGYITWWRATSRDAAGRLSGHRTGNGLVTINDYDPATGHLNSIQSGFGFGNLIRSLDYEYDALNNVSARYDNVQNVQETFVYDRLNRLTESTVDGEYNAVPYTNVIGYSYDALGNMLNKSDVGQYKYGDSDKGLGGNAGPHALHQVARTAGGFDEYVYDANGSMLSGGGRDIHWTSFNKPSHFAKDGNVIDFSYGPDRKRYKKTTVSTDFTAETTLYLGKAYERIEDQNGQITHKHFMYVEGQIAAIHIEKEDGNGVVDSRLDETRYLHRDSLGSIDTITNGIGEIVSRNGYSAFGARRQGNWETVSGIPLQLYTNRGFTGHEHIDEAGLIHMNGRVYDPELGRFLSADPHVQAPYNSQSYNRYSYVLNNPLKYTDPSGYFFKKLFRAVKRVLKSQVFRLVAGIALGVLLGPGGAWMLTGNTIANGAIAGFAGGFVASGGNFKAALIGAVTGAAFAQIGVLAKAGKWSIGTKMFAHGVVGGVRSELSGGKFAKGFASAGLTKAAAGPIDNQFGDNVFGGAVASAVVGGTISSATGGKFANGAITGAFAYTFNEKGPMKSRNDGLCTQRACEPAGISESIDSTQEDIFRAALTYTIDSISKFPSLVSSGPVIDGAFALGHQISISGNDSRVVMAAITGSTIGGGTSALTVSLAGAKFGPFGLVLGAGVGMVAGDSLIKFYDKYTHGTCGQGGRCTVREWERVNNMKLPN